MTSTFASSTTFSRVLKRAGTGARARVVASLPMQGAIVLPSRSPGPGRP